MSVCVRILTSVLPLLLPLAVLAGSKSAQTPDGSSAPGGELPPGASRNSVGMVLVRIYPGEFMMGSESGEENERPPHKVAIERPYLMSRTEVTQAQYEAVMRENPAKGPCADFGVGPDLPVTCVSWLDAVRFVNALSEREKLEPCYRVLGEEVMLVNTLGCTGYRLPTEAEWEYAARGGKTTAYAGTNDVKEVCRYGNVADATARTENLGSGYVICSDGVSRLAPVGKFQPNPWGLYDMTGNVWEWVWDGYAPYSAEVDADPTGPASASKRVLRGGSWIAPPRVLMVPVRGFFFPSIKGGDLGFRVVRSARP